MMLSIYLSVDELSVILYQLEGVNIDDALDMPVWPSYGTTCFHEI